MNVSITIRDVPQETRDELAARAARSGRSLQEYLRRELERLFQRPDPDALLASVESRVERTESTFPVEDILSARDADRR